MSSPDRASDLAIQDDDPSGVLVVAAADEVDAAADRVARVVRAVPAQLHLAGRELSVGERADPSAGDVVDVHPDTAGARDAQADRGRAVPHERVLDLHEVDEVAAAP